MGIAVGKNALQKLFNWTPRKSWYKELRKSRHQIVDSYRERSEILDGGIVTEGTETATELVAGIAECKVMLAGRQMTLAALATTSDLLTAATGIGQAIYDDGSNATAAALASGEVAYVTLIICNTDGAGGADTDDGGTCLVVAVISGSGTGDYDAEHVTSAEIQAALDASDGVHDGTTAWAHLAQLTWTDTGGSAWAIAVTMNRNNVVSEA